VKVRVLALLAVAASVVAAVGVSSPASAASPIVIGWADDSTGNMAAFDQPALAAAKVEVAKINAKGGVTGRPLKIVTCDTQGNKPDVAKSCGAKLVGEHVNVIFTTCDVDYATPVVQESISAGLLTISPCIGTDQMGPSRFGP
jgi:branched-chain amino acid transport system substrate-binding protein